MNRQDMERAIVRKLIRELKASNYLVESVWDGEEYVKSATEAETLDAVFAVDESTIHFDRGAGAIGKAHGVYIVLGNGPDCISDFHCADEVFAKVVESIYDWIEARGFDTVQS